jgi:N6-adenosine-specific RNA methylase IME4
MMTGLEAWGFDYRSCMVWVKPSIGPGLWFRQRHELLLLGLKGKVPVPLEAYRPDSVIEAPRRQHSQKPEEVCQIIEHAFPEFDRIELFSRSPRAGWDAWGNEPGGSR